MWLILLLAFEYPMSLEGRWKACEPPGAVGAVILNACLSLVLLAGGCTALIFFLDELPSELITQFICTFIASYI